MQSLLGTNYRMPLLHRSKIHIWLEEKNQRIDEFSIGYMMSQNLNRNRAFRDQVKVCLKHTQLDQIPVFVSLKHYQKNNRLLALVIFYESGGKL